MKHRLLLLLALLLGVVPAARATSVGFSNDSVVLQEAGGAPAADLTVEIGGFNGGFVPTSQNRDQWAGHWVTAGAGYYAHAGAAVEWNAELTASSNTALAAGQALYVWAHDATNAGLYSDPTWTMPVATPTGLGVTYGFTASTTAVFGSYDAGAATASIAAMTLAFDTQPASQAVVVGTDVTFTAAASGTGTLTYQWNKDGSPLNGATDASLTLPNVQLADAGSYTVTVSNGLFTATSGAAILRVRVAGAPLITAQPAGFTAEAGSTAALSVTATGATGLTYQWYLNGNAISNATAATLAFNPIQISDAGSYTVVVTSSAGSETSTAALVTVTKMPQITSQPVSVTVNQGATATFSVSVTAEPVATYQWYHDNAALSGSTAATLQLSGVQPSDAGNYTVIATNAAGSVTSDVAVLAVNVPPTITVPPVTQQVNVSGNVTFSVTAIGTGPLNYQWKKDNSPIGGATDPTLTLTDVQSSAAGSYTVTVSNVAGSVTSGAAILSVYIPLNGYANASAGSTDAWNPANSAIKWTTDGGAHWQAASAGNTYHTNGYIVKAGRIGVAGGTPGSSAFAGETLVVDGFDAASGLVGSGATGGQVYFDLAATNSGPRLSPTAPTQGIYTVNLVTAATTGSDIRTIRSGNGVTLLEGTLALNGYTTFNLPSSVSDMLFQIDAPVTGTGSMEFSGGSAGGGTINGYATWAFADLSQWKGARISVLNKHTISFLNRTDFYVTNPAMQLAFSSASIGFINLQADISVGSGKLTFTTGTTSNPAPHTVTDGVYTVASLNAYVADVSGTNTYATQPIASEGATNVAVPNTTGTTYKIYVGRALPPVITTQPQSQTASLGEDITFTVAAQSGATATYQWKKDGTDIVGATSATLVLPAVTGAAAGGYTVVVTNSTDSVTSSVATLTFNKILPAITWDDPAAILYGTALSAAQLNATADVPGTFVYTPAAGTVLDAGVDQPLGVTFTPTDTATYATATASTAITVNPIIPVITWAEPAAITYGAALDAAQLNATAEVAGTFTYTPAPGTVLDAGVDRPLTVTFAPDDPNYTTATGSTTITVNQATPTITWAPPAAIPYGAALTAAQLNATAGGVAGTFTYTPALGTVLNAGAGQTLSVTFTPTDTANYTTATGSTTITVVNQVAPTITWAPPAAITYGTALSATQLNATANVPGTFAYTPALGTVLNAGAGQTLSVTFTPTDTVNYAPATVSATITVNQATPIITWAIPAAIPYGTALSATQLNASAGGVAGTFTYAPAVGTVLDIGADQPLSVSFTPTDTANYTTANGSTTLTVNQATSAITWPAPAAITYGAALSAAQLNATAGVPGTFAYTPASGTVLDAGADRTLSVTFTPSDPVRYATAQATTKLTVNQATPTITWSAPAAITYGTLLSAAQLNATANVAGTFAYSPAKDAKLNAGSQPLQVTFTPTDPNYATVEGNTTLTVNKAATTVTWTAPAAITYGTALSATQLNATADVPGTFTYTPAAGTVLSVGASQALSVTITPTSGNYEAANGSTTLTVNKVPLTAKASDASRTAGTANPTFAITYTGFVNGDTAAAITAPTASTTATEASAPGTYPITLTGGSAANYTFTLQDGTLTVIPASYAGSYFGTFPSGGTWALSLKPDNTGKYIAYLPARHSAIVVDLTVGPDGTFTVTGTEIVAAAVNAVSALALGNPEAPVQRTAAAAANYTLSGTIGFDGTVSGQLTGLNETFSGAADAATGPAQASAGLYTASALGTASGETYAIVGASGQAVVVTTGASVDGASGTVDASGQLSTPTSGGAALVLTIDPNAHSVAASLTPAGGGEPVVYNGVASTVTAEARVVNLSVRSQAGTGSQTLIVGLVINGGGNKTLLLRGVGPALVPYGVVNALADPAMRLLDKDGTQLDSNDDWDNSLAAHITELGASAYAPNSKDAALYKQLSGGVYSMHVYPAATGTGVVLAELYDADATATGAEVVNISARTQVGLDENILILGFVIRGNTPKTLLIRGVGPTLIPLGVTDGLVDPQLYLYQGNTVLTTNDNWGGTTALKNAAATVGAGALVSDSSKDAALLVTLAPGVYSAQVSGVGRTTGVGLVEIFLLP